MTNKITVVLFLVLALVIGGMVGYSVKINNLITGEPSIVPGVGGGPGTMDKPSIISPIAPSPTSTPTPTGSPTPTPIQIQIIIPTATPTPSS